MGGKGKGRERICTFFPTFICVDLSRGNWMLPELDAQAIREYDPFFLIEKFLRPSFLLVCLFVRSLEMLRLFFLIGEIHVRFYPT